MKARVRKRAPHREATWLTLLTPALFLVLRAALLAATVEDVAREAERAFAAGDYAQAVASLQSAIEKAPEDAALHSWLGRCHYELGQYDRAVEQAQRAVALAPGRSEYHRWLGRALGRRAERSGWLSAIGLARRTREEFETAVRLDSLNIRAQRDLIEFYGLAPGLVGGGVEKAWRQADTLAAIDPVEAHLARAQIWADRHEPLRAEAEYRQVVAARPTRASPYYEVAEFYEQRGDAPRVADAVETAALLDPVDPRLVYHRGVAAILDGGRGEEAERLLRRYLDTVPVHSDLPSRAAVREWLGRLYEREGRRQAAANEYRAALQLEGDRQGAREALRRLEGP